MNSICYDWKPYHNKQSIRNEYILLWNVNWNVFTCDGIGDGDADETRCGDENMQTQ